MGIKLAYKNISNYILSMEYTDISYKVHENTVCCIMVVTVHTATYDVYKADITGIATTKNEEFDLEKGKRLARSRAEREANLFYEQCIKEYIHRCENKIKEATQKLLKVRNYIEHKKSYIRKF